MSLFVFLTQTNSIAAEYFCQILREEGCHQAKILFNPEEVLRIKPDFVMMTAYDHPEEYALASAWVNLIKENLPSAKFILGGPAFRSRPVAFFKNLKADYALRGEADFTFKQLINEITKDKPKPEELRNIPGIMFKENKKLFINKEYPCLNRKQIESLNFSHFCIHGSDLASVFTERGCPYGCTFCSRVFGKAIRSISVDRIMQILGEISENRQIKRILFANDNMIYNLRRADNLFGRIIKEKFNQRFEFVISARIDNFITDDKKFLPHKINFDLIDLLVKANVVKISFGTESLNDADIKRLKPEARYSGTEAMRLTRELGTRGITVVHSVIWPSPEARFEEAIESTCRRLLIIDSYADFIEAGIYFANPTRIYLIRGSTLYNRALAKEFKVVEYNNPNGKEIDIFDVEKVEQEKDLQKDEEFFLPFLTPVNSFGTSSDPYQNLLLLEREFKELQINQQRSDKEEERFEKLSKCIKRCRKQVNKINQVIKKIDCETRTQLNEMLNDLGGLGVFLQKFSKLSVSEKRKQLAKFTEEFHDASIQAESNALKSDTRQIFFLFVLNAANELLSSPGKERKIIKKYKNFTQKMIINKMIKLREKTPLHIYTKFLGKDLPIDKTSNRILEKHVEKSRG